MRIVKSIVVAAIAVGLVTGTVVGVAAQSAEPTPRRASGTAAGTPAAVLVTGPFESNRGVSGFAEDIDADGVRQQRGRESHGNSEMSDPRLSGDVVLNDNADRYCSDPCTDAAFADVLWGTIEITNDGGSWAGTSAGTSDVSAGGAGITYYELTGAGGYDGLSAILLETETAAGELTWNGVIFPGELSLDR